MLRKYGPMRHISLPVLCVIFLISVICVYITDFPTFSIVNRSNSVIQLVYNNQAQPKVPNKEQFTTEYQYRETMQLRDNPHPGDIRIERVIQITKKSEEERLTKSTTEHFLTRLKLTEKNNFTFNQLSKPRLLDDYKMAEVEKRFELRRNHLKKYCNKTMLRQMKKCEADDVIGSLKHVEDGNIVYCAIEKTGSTFWKRILHVAGGWGNDSNPHSIKSKDVDVKNGGFQSLVNVTNEKLMDMFQTTESIMFVRDPFTRLFSAWLDKFYSTNPYYWTLYGRRIIRTERRHASNFSRHCGHDVTFTEFVSFFSKYVKRDRCLDRHFNPNFKHCAPCYLNYDYIGKYETLKEDTYYLLQKLNLSDVVKFTNFENDAVNDIITNDADWVFRKRNETENCVPFRCGLFRVWKRLQSRGIISKHLELPYRTNREADIITVEDFTQAIRDANKKSDPRELARNRKEVLAEAFGFLPLKVKNNMLESLSPDFAMFEYNRNPWFLKRNYTRGNMKEYTIDCPYTFEDP